MKRSKTCIILVLILLVGISIGYAVLNSTLTINGTSNIEKNTWDIYFDNIQVKNGSVGEIKKPTIDNKNKVDFEVNLKIPGDFYEFTFDVVNNGTIDAMIGSFEKTPDLSTEQQKYLNYIIEYQNGEQITTKQLVKASEFVRLKVRVEYKKDITAFDLPLNTETLNLGFETNYIQADETSVSVKDNGVFYVWAYGSLDDIGTVVTIGNEMFFTIGTEGENVKLISKYNLYVGNSVDENFNVTPLSNPTGIQSEASKGYYWDYELETEVYPFIGTAGYDKDTYTGSQIEKYVIDYKNILENKYDVEILDSRLISYDELSNSSTFDCSHEQGCNEVYPWIYSSTFWVYTEDELSVEWIVYNGGALSFEKYNLLDTAGVRPVIVMKKSDISIYDLPITISDDINKIGTIVTIGTEKFYTIGTDEYNVKLLSMYNLLVGNSVDEEWNPTPLENPTGMQSEISRGCVHDQTTFFGTTAFSSGEQKGEYYSSYKGSIVEGYVNNYKKILEDQFKMYIREARILKYDEVGENSIFNCSHVSGCDDKYPWINSTSYWVESDYNSDNIPVIFQLEGFNSELYSYEDIAGVRPVIVVSKNYFK